MRGSVAFVLKGYPRLSETFIAQEIRELERRKISIHIFSLRHPTDATRHPIHDEITAPLSYLPEYLHHEPLRVARAWWAMRSRPAYAETVKQWRHDFKRDRTRNRVRRLGQALVLAHELPASICHFHAHFMHTPASVARYASLLTGLAWSASAHAKDIWTSPAWELREKLAECQWAVTCTAFNLEYLQKLAPCREKVELVYHGLDLNRFPEPADTTRTERDACAILSVGRAVAKKGYACLLEALSRLPDDADWRFVHVGGGTLLDGLKRRASELGIEDRVSWLGPRPQHEVLAEYAKSDVFVLASRIADDGDRDGLPNVLMEAQSQRLACVSTRVSAIPELIEHGVSGLLVEPDNPQALAECLTRVVLDRRLRRELGAAGNRRVRAEFSLSTAITRLVERFNRTLAAAGTGGGR